jgi:glycosyltransferase involved in cell wall biosynthesis
VRLLGHRSDIADLLAAADVVVATSVWEGQPLLVQEALRAGAPLVATAVGGVLDVAGEAALLVPAGDVAAVDTTVRRLLDDGELRERYAAAGPRQAATWPSDAEATARVAAAYAELVAAGRPAGRR